MQKVKVRLQPIVNRINLPTVIKTAIPPNDTKEILFIATQVGEVFYIGDGVIETFLDIRQEVINLGTFNGGYDERGLLGLAFHPSFHFNGLFYLHYSVAGTQGPGALTESFEPNPCKPETLKLEWTNRENQYDHIDTVEEWILLTNGETQKRRTLLNLRRPFFNHNGVNSLNFSPETGNLVLTTGDGGSGFDPFNLSQNDLEIAGKIIEIDVSMNAFNEDSPIVSRFNELPESIQESLTVIAKGVRNIPGISYQRYNSDFMKYVGNVGQHLVESIFSFDHYHPIPVTRIVRESENNSNQNYEGLINLGWRGWEGTLPTSILRSCEDNESIKEKTIVYYDEAIDTSVKRIYPLTSYYHIDTRPNKFAGTALTGLQAYIGNEISDLTGCVVFTDFATSHHSQAASGVLAYTKVISDCKLNDYSVIEVDYDFGSQANYYTCLGTNQGQTRLFLGVYGSRLVTNLYQGMIFEIVP